MRSDCCCGCGHTHGYDKKADNLLPFLLRLGGSAVLTVLASAFSFPYLIRLALFLTAYGVSGYKVILSAAKNISRGKVFDENFLMLVATAGAFAIGDYREAVAVMLFFGVGELLQTLAVTRSRRSIRALMDLRPDFAWLKTPNGISSVSPDTVRVGDTIVVRPGERIPLDSSVAAGNSALDVSALTGESLPKEVFPGDEVLSGSVNQSGVLELLVSRPASESTVSRILELAEHAAAKKSETEKFITVFARYYTPIVVTAAAATALIPPLLTGLGSFHVWLYRALTFLIVSCPCALVVSIPITYFAGIGGASRRGILFKGASSLEALSRVKTVVFDKTGTLTKGTFSVTDVLPADGVSKERLLSLAALAESGSNHPVARSILAAFAATLTEESGWDRKEEAGFGVSVHTEEGALLAGNARLMERHGVAFARCNKPGTAVYLAVNGTLAGALVVADELRPSAKEAVTRLRGLGIKKVVILTGDTESAAKAVAEEIGVDKVYSGLLPAGKVEVLEHLLEQGKAVFVGDGINDAPVLARADVGVAMGGLGSDAAVEAADIVLMQDDPGKLPLAFRIASRTHRLVIENVVFSLGVKFLVLALSLFGIASMWSAVFADTGVTLLAVLNALRGLRVNEE